MHKNIFKLLKLLLSFAIICGLIWLADPKSLLNSLLEVTVLEFTFLMLLSFCMIAVSALKWQLFINYLGNKVKFLNLYSLYLSGYFVNAFLPSYIGGDALRSYYIGKSVGQHQALSATILERYTGLIAMSVLGMFAACVNSDLLNSAIRITVFLFGLAVLVLTLVLYFVRFDNFKFQNKYLAKIFTTLSRLHDLMLSTSKQHDLWIKTMLLSFAYHFLTIANTYFTALAVGWYDVPITQLFVVIPIILVVGALPITPSGLGIQEGAFFHFLQMLGATAPQALGIAVVLRAKTYVLAMIGWVVWSKRKDT